MRHASLFSGIGGFELAATWMGWENVLNCEIDPFPRKVLNYYWPKAIQYEDIKTTDFTIHRGGIDILTGGFPCQPYSTAGKRLGKEDERHLWPEMLRAIREIQPRWVVGENVRGLTNWNGGLVFDEVQADLEAEGYEVTPFLLPACGVNAPHRRDRIWFVAHASSDGFGRDNEFEEGFQCSDGREALGGVESPAGFVYAPYAGSEQCQKRSNFNRERADAAQNSPGVDNRTTRPCPDGITPDANGFKREGGMYETKPKAAKRHIGPCNAQIDKCSGWHNFPTQSPVHLRDDGVSSKLLIFVVKELQNEISKTSKENRIENLHEVWERISQEEVWQQIRGFYSLDKKDVLLQTMQLYSTGYKPQSNLSPFGEDLCKPVLRHLRKYKEFRRSPQGRKLEKQRDEQFGNTLSFLPHEIALAARRFEAAITKFETWHRTQSIKAYGNAVVPQVVFEIFKAIELFEKMQY